MKSKKCPQCESNISENASFCGKCGTQVRCKNCKEDIEPGSRFCIGCGIELGRPEKRNAPNNFEFHENAEGRSVKAEFTDTAVKDMSQTLGNFFANRQIALNSHIDERVAFTDSEEIMHEVVDVDDNVSTDSEKREPLLNDKNEFPALKAIVMKNLPANESEWVVVYSFYASKFGKEIFSRNDLLSLYDETNRKTKNRVKSLSAYIKSVVNSDCINPINNDGDFTILDDGIERAKEILNRKSSSTSKSKSVVKDRSSKSNNESKSTHSSRVKTGYSVLDLGITEAQRQKLRTFFSECAPKSQKDKVLVLGYWLEKEGGLEGFDVNEIYTALQIVSEKTPGALGQMLRDIKKDGKIARGGKSKKYNLNHIGLDYVKFDLGQNG